MILNNNKKGFTLVELIVSIGIFVFITAAVLLNFRYGNFAGELRTNADVFASYLRQAQNMTQSGVITENTSAYGIFITTEGSYVLFADLDRNNFYDEDQDRDLTIENFRFVNFNPDNVNISIVFSPPKPKVCLVDFDRIGDPYIELRGDDGRYEEHCDQVGDLVFTLTHQKSGDSRTVSLNPISGQISID